MSQLTQTFRSLAEKDEAALIPYFMMGYPTVDMALRLVRAAVHAGADIIELGVPFSDPLADGRTLQTVGQVAIASGGSVLSCLEVISSLRQEGVNIPFVVMSYINPLLAYGLDRFASDLATAGGDGTIVPDLPIEASDEFEQCLSDKGLPLIRMVAPTTDSDRLKRIVANAKGFIYCVSVTGVTGSRSTVPDELHGFLKTIKNSTNVPVAVGFGISQPIHARHVAEVADGVIIGTAIAELMAATASQELPKRVSQFLSEMKAATVRLRR